MCSSDLDIRTYIFDRCILDSARFMFDLFVADLKMVSRFDNDDVSDLGGVLSPRPPNGAKGAASEVPSSFWNSEQLPNSEQLT